jgi:hypothetical protein
MSPANPSAVKTDELPHDVLEQLLDDLEVPGDRRAEAAATLRQLFRLARIDHALHHAAPAAALKRQKLNKELTDLAKAAAAFRAKVEKLSEPARVLTSLEVESARHLSISVGIDCILAAIDAFGQSPKQYPGLPRKSSPLQRLVFFLYLLEEEAGWHISVDHGNRSGTLVEFLRHAEPYLPKGFIPPTLWSARANGSPGSGWKRFQRIGTELRRPRDNAAMELATRVVAAALQRRAEK